MNLLGAIFQLNPQVVRISNDTAYDANGNEVQYDKAAAQALVDATAQAAMDAKQSALNKLMALGLTEEEALALGAK
jgi:hypothetical protein